VSLGRAAIAATSCLLFAACATPPPVSVAALPPVKEYSAEFTQRFSAEFSALSGDSAIVQYVIDQQALRCQVRAARGDPLPETCAP
jgi:hypothetical protein